MNITKSVLLSGLVAAVGASVQAATYQDIDKISTANQFISRAHNRTDGFFNIVTGDHDVITIGSPYFSPQPQTFRDVGGFSPGGSEHVTAAYAWFFFRDNNDKKSEAVRVDLERFKFSQTFATTTIANMGFSIFGGEAVGSIKSLEEDGVLKYQINRMDGDFYFDYALLVVQTPGAQHIADGGSAAMLLGLGVLAMGAIRRKLA